MPIKAVKKQKQVRNYNKEPLWDKDGNITRDIGFELQFGFPDNMDIPFYKESPGNDIIPIGLPSNKITLNE